MQGGGYTVATPSRHPRFYWAERASLRLRLFKTIKQGECRRFAFGGGPSLWPIGEEIGAAKKGLGRKNLYHAPRLFQPGSPVIPRVKRDAPELAAIPPRHGLGGTGGAFPPIGPRTRLYAPLRGNPEKTLPRPPYPHFKRVVHPEIYAIFMLPNMVKFTELGFSCVLIGFWKFAHNGMKSDTGRYGRQNIRRFGRSPAEARSPRGYLQETGRRENDRQQARRFLPYRPKR